MSNWLDVFHKHVRAIVGSDSFFKVVIGLFVLQAGAIALMSRYPMAFDESYHLGVIQLHAQQWTPFFGHLPTSAFQFGALSTEPSYLYHYLMSFPYRFIALLSQDPFVIVNYSRFINIAFFAGALVVFRKSFCVLGVSKALNNFVLMVFAFLPLTTLLAAHINYDNLMFLFMALMFLFATKVLTGIRKNKTLQVSDLTLLAIFSISVVQVKYTSIAFVFPVVAYVLIVALYYYRRNKKVFTKNTKKNYVSISAKSKYILAAALMICLGLGVLRIGYNVLNYQAVAPKCEKVLSEKSCSSSVIWVRDKTIKEAKLPEPNASQKIAYIKNWVKVSINGQLVILSPFRDDANLPAVKQFVAGFAVFVVFGFVLLVFYGRQVFFNHPELWFYLFVSMFYSAVLFYKNYSDFLFFGREMAVQARYILPVVLPLIMLLAIAYNTALKKHARYKSVLVVFAIIIGVQGGGIVTYLLRVDSRWYWSQQVTLPYTPGKEIR